MKDLKKTNRNNGTSAVLTGGGGGGSQFLHCPVAGLFARASVFKCKLEMASSDWMLSL